MHAHRFPWLLAVTAVFLILREPLLAAEAPTPLAAAVQRTLEATGPILIGAGKPVETEALKTFYEQRQNVPLWVDATGLNSRGQALLRAFEGSARDGLDPADYDPGAAVRAAAETDQLAATELGLSASLLRYATDIRRGRAVPEKMDDDQRIAPRPIDPAQVLAGAATAPDVNVYVASLAPADPFYLGLRQALDRYRAIAAAGGWPAIPAGGKLALGSNDARVSDLRRHLQLTGDLAAEPTGQVSTRYDETVRQAVRRFQERHGLSATGDVNAGTLQALNVPVSTRIRQILINLERARWLPEDLGDPYVLVNMAAFELDVVEAGKPVLEMRVVVGERENETPVFSDEISYIEINPYWNVPKSIAYKEKLPQLRRNPNALAAQNIKVIGPGGTPINPASIDWSTVGANFPYRLRQEPGPRNALGRIKFMFPNPYDVYLHDTPSRALFKRQVRAFSHGCIRVEKPMELAEFLLRGSWSRERIQKAIDAGKNRAITLMKPVPVHLVYLTAWVDPEGMVQFRDDLYNRDARLVAALDAKRE
jgi:L,D-transpeptidase YcbB